MITSNLKNLVTRLDATCKSAIEGAAGLCLSRTHYEVEIEHLLAKLLEANNTDLHAILRHYEINESRVSADSEQGPQCAEDGKHAHARPFPAPAQADRERLAAGVGRLQRLPDPQRSPAHRAAIRLRVEPAGEGRDAGLRQGQRRGAEEAFRGAYLEIGRSGSGRRARELPARAPEEAPRASGKTPGLDQYTVNLTERARLGKIDPVLGPRPGDPPAHRHPDAPAPEQPDPHRRGWCGQDRRRGRLCAAHRGGRRSAAAEERCTCIRSTWDCCRPAPA